MWPASTCHARLAGHRREWSGGGSLVDWVPVTVTVTTGRERGGLKKGEGWCRRLFLIKLRKYKPEARHAVVQMCNTNNNNMRPISNQHQTFDLLTNWRRGGVGGQKIIKIPSPLFL